MLKEDIKQTIEKHIKKTLQKDEVQHSTYEPDNPHSASDNVTGLDLCLSDVKWAIGTNDFQGFEEQIQSFIKTELAQPSLPITSSLYRYLARQRRKYSRLNSSQKLSYYRKWKVEPKYVWDKI